MSDEMKRRSLVQSILRKSVMGQDMEIQRFEERVALLDKEHGGLEQRKRAKENELRVFLIKYGEVMRKKENHGFRPTLYARLVEHAGEVVADDYRKITGEMREMEIALSKLNVERNRSRTNIVNCYRLRNTHQEQLLALSRTHQEQLLALSRLESLESMLKREREKWSEHENKRRGNTYSLHTPKNIDILSVKSCYYLDASDSTIGDKDLASLTRLVNLKALNLIDTNVTYEGLESLRLMPILRTLFIPSHLSASRVKRIFWNNPHLVVNEPMHDWMDHWITVTKI